LAVEHRRANRQYAKMPDREVWGFISSREKLFVAFSMMDGYPHVTPVWFCVHDGKLYFRVQSYKPKAKLADGGKVCCVVDDGRRYVELRGVTIWGRSRVVTEEALIATVKKIMDDKYREHQWARSEMPEEWVRERESERRVYVEVTPEKMSSWDNSRIALRKG
jgi:nitroimidazol reductase NimA-like FMN-containing flavoprotein (pyridoxamine 5'-phosphate oxidase superfamily)